MSQRKRQLRKYEKAGEFVTNKRTTTTTTKNPEKAMKEIKIHNLPDKEFKALVVRMLTNLGKGIYEHSENFNKELENIYFKKPVRNKEYSK